MLWKYLFAAFCLLCLEKAALASPPAISCQITKGSWCIVESIGQLTVDDKIYYRNWNIDTSSGRMVMAERKECDAIQNSARISIEISSRFEDGDEIIQTNFGSGCIISFRLTDPGIDKFNAMRAIGIILDGKIAGLLCKFTKRSDELTKTIQVSNYENC